MNLEADVRLPNNNKHPVSNSLFKLHSILRLSSLEVSLFALYILYILFPKPTIFTELFVAPGKSGGNFESKMFPIPCLMLI